MSVGCSPDHAAEWGEALNDEEVFTPEPAGESTIQPASESRTKRARVLPPAESVSTSHDWNAAGEAHGQSTGWAPVSLGCSWIDLATIKEAVVKLASTCALRPLADALKLSPSAAGKFSSPASFPKRWHKLMSHRRRQAAHHILSERCAPSYSVCVFCVVKQVHARVLLRAKAEQRWYVAIHTRRICR